jgi:hypothetical protein
MDFASRDVTPAKLPRHAVECGSIDYRLGDPDTNAGVGATNLGDDCNVGHLRRRHHLGDGPGPAKALNLARQRGPSKYTWPCHRAWGQMPRTVVLLRAAPPIKCPKCGAQIGWDRASFHVQFLCPACRSGLHVRNSYGRVVNIASIVATGLVAYALGIRGDALFWLVCLGWFPASVVLLNITLRLFTPDAELTGEFRGILYREPAQTRNSDDGPAKDHESKEAND